MNKLNKLVGFIVMTFMYAEVFAENRKAKTVHHKVAEQLSGDSKLYGMQLNIGGFYGSKSKGASKNASYGLVDVLLPLYQTQDSLVQNVYWVGVNHRNCNKV